MVWASERFGERGVKLSETTPIPSETRLDSSTRLVYKLKDNPKNGPKPALDPQARRVLVILDSAAGIALSRFMGDNDDFRPGKVCGDFIREALAKRGYLHIVTPEHDHRWKLGPGQLVFCVECGKRQE